MIDLHKVIMDESKSMITPESFVSIFNLVPYNMIPHPTSLTIEQRQDVSPAVLGKPEPHKYIYLHFKYSEIGISKQIIMHQYRNYRRHNWFSQDDTDKLNLFRIAAIALQKGVDISRGKRRWRYLTEEERKEWLPRLREFAEETEVRESREPVEEALEKATHEEYANEEVMGDAADEAVDESMQGSVQGSVQEPARRSIGETISGTTEKESSREEPESDNVAVNREHKVPFGNLEESGNESIIPQSGEPSVFRGHRPRLPFGFSGCQIAKGLNATRHTNDDTVSLIEALRNLIHTLKDDSPNMNSPYTSSPLTDSLSAAVPSRTSMEKAKRSNSAEASDVLTSALNSEDQGRVSYFNASGNYRKELQ